MRKAVIVIVVAAAAGGFYRLSTDPSRDSASEPSRISPSPVDSTASENPPETNQSEAAWQKLRGRLNERLAEVPAGGSESDTDSQAGEEPPVFDTRADWLAAAGVTPEEEEAYFAWALERGIELESLGYEFYDRETLQALADSGDLFALQRLGDRAAWGEQQLEQAEVLYREAATRGSVVALDRLALNETSKAMASAHEDQQQSAKGHLLKALAWNEVSRRRSGGLPIPAMREANVRQHLEKLDVTLNDDDRESIQAQAEALYQQLSESREKLDLGDFDNAKAALIEKLERQGLDKPSIRNP